MSIQVGQVYQNRSGSDILIVQSVTPQEVVVLKSYTKGILWEPRPQHLSQAADALVPIQEFFENLSLVNDPQASKLRANAQTNGHII